GRRDHFPRQRGCTVAGSSPRRKPSRPAEGLGQLKFHQKMTKGRLGKLAFFFVLAKNPDPNNKKAGVAAGFFVRLGRHQAMRSPFLTLTVRLSTPGSILAGSRVTTTSMMTGPLVVIAF